MSLKNPVRVLATKAEVGNEEKNEDRKVKVIVRIRPSLPNENSKCVFIKGRNALEIVNPKNPNENLHYTFDNCYDSNTQQQTLYDQEVSPLLDYAFVGENVTIFAYGNTGAGKTYTMQGEDTPEKRGIIPRAIHEILMKKIALSQQPKSTGHEEIRIQMSFIEIYNEKVYDLLVPKEQDLQIREDQQKNIFIANLAQLPISTIEEFDTLYANGVKNRSTAATSLNVHSSRSHSIVCLKIQVKKKDKSIFSKVHLIDLAGSEDNRRTDNVGIRLTESGAINKSLFVLANVVDALNQKSLRVPYRDSKLTRMLQDSLGGNSHSLMVANIAPSIQYHLNTCNTLNFASKSRKIVNRPLINEQTEPAPDQLKAERKILLSKWQKSKALPKISSSNESFSTDDSLDESYEEPINKNIKAREKLQHKPAPLLSSQLRGTFSDPVQDRLEALEKRLLTPKTIKYKKAEEHLKALEDYIKSSEFTSNDEKKLKDKINRLSKEIELDEEEKENIPVSKKRKAPIDDDDYVPEPKVKKTKVKPAELNLDTILNKVDPVKKEKAEQTLLEILNSGNEKAIMELDGIGKKRAQKITEFRESNGNFNQLQDLQRAGLGDKLIYNMLKEHLLNMDITIS